MANWQLKLLYDGDCPLCAREVAMLTRFNRTQRLALENIAAPTFSAAQYGLTQEEVMGHIHGVLPDGRIVTGMEALRRAYQAVGLGFLMSFTALPGLKQLSDRGYAWFARNRLRLTGRSCESGTCQAPRP